MSLVPELLATRTVCGSVFALVLQQRPLEYGLGVELLKMLAAAEGIGACFRFRTTHAGGLEAEGPPISIGIRYKSKRLRERKAKKSVHFCTFDLNTLIFGEDDETIGTAVWRCAEW